MADNLDICKVCLRTDVTLKEIDKVLSNYFEAVTDFRLFHIDTRLCSQCEYLLRKSYNFNRKCEKASKILQNWIHRNLFQRNTGKTKKPLNCLYKEVPQIPLEVYRQNDSKIYYYYFKDESTSNLDEDDDFIAEKNTQDIIKRETDSDILLSEVYSNDIIAVKNEKTTNSFQEVLIQDDIFKRTGNNTEIELLNENDTDLDDNDVDVNEIYYTDLDENDDDMNVKKVDINVNDIDLNKTNDIDLDETDGDINVNDTAIKATNDIRQTTNDDDLSSDDECLAAKISKNTQYNDSKKDNKSKNMSQEHDKDLYVVNITKNDETLNKSEKNIVNKLQIMNKDLTAIYKDWKNICLTELPQITLTKDDVAKRYVSKKKMAEKDDLKGKKKGVLAKLDSIYADLDFIKECNGKLIDYKEGLMNPKDSLRSELITKFSNCGDLKTEDGYVINKDIIINCFDRVSECLMRRLWRFVHGKPTFEPRAINTLKHIQNKYQNEYQYESVFHIEYLNTKEKVAEEFEKRRTYECYINAKYRCEMCYLGFKCESQSENHMHSHEESAGDFVCQTCGVRHKSKKSLDTHSKSHEAVYKCKLCPLVTYYRYSMINHYHQHKGLLYSCEQCSTTFKSKSAYKTHVGLRHTEGSHTCTICGRSLTSQRALHGHMAKAHSRGSQNTALSEPACPVCKLKFASQEAYLRHAQLKHTTNKYTTQKDKAIMPKKKPVHICRVCNESGHSIGWLSLHFRVSHPAVDMALLYADKQQYLCDICGKGYSNMHSLRDHLSIHAGVRAHECASCGARFHRAVSLAQHAATHQPPRRACSVCRKRFRSLSNLNNHMRGHIGDRRYKCHLCGKGFLHRNALNEHIRGVHYKQRRARKKNTDKLTNDTAG